MTERAVHSRPAPGRWRPCGSDRRRTAVAQRTEITPSPNSRFEIAPRAYVQFDWRGFPEWPVTPGSGRLNFDTFEVRRARVGVDGRLGRVSYEFTVDPQDLDDTFVRDAYGRWRFSRAFELQAGQFKVPGGREYQESARTLDFMERPALAQMASAGRDLGAMALGDLGRIEYQLGVFAGDGRGRGSRAKLTAAGRVVWQRVPRRRDSVVRPRWAAPRRWTNWRPTASTAARRRGTGSSIASTWTADGCAWVATRVVAGAVAADGRRALPSPTRGTSRASTSRTCRA